MLGHPVHCRTGSLENPHTQRHHAMFVHCRTGSLEIRATVSLLRYQVHCRTGSLEKSGEHG